MNIYFILALLSSVLGPVLYYFIPEKTRTSGFMDGLIITALVGLVTLHIVPESLEYSGTVTIAAVVLGLIGPSIFSKLTKRSECEIQKPFLIFTALGFIAHNMLDGAALVIHPDEQSSTHLLALAVVVHRLIVSMALWRTSSKDFGFIKCCLGLIGLSFAMAFGYFFSEQIFTRMEAGILHILQSLSCGMLFHILLHPHHFKEILTKIKTPRFFLQSQSVGAFCGLLLAVLTYLYWPSHTHVHNHADHANKEHHDSAQHNHE